MWDRAWRCPGKGDCPLARPGSADFRIRRHAVQPRSGGRPVAHGVSRGVAILLIIRSPGGATRGLRPAWSSGADPLTPTLSLGGEGGKREEGDCPLSDRVNRIIGLFQRGLSPFPELKQSRTAFLARKRRLWPPRAGKKRQFLAIFGKFWKVLESLGNSGASHGHFAATHPPFQ
jgi:hypothetical protein